MAFPIMDLFGNIPGKCQIPRLLSSPADRGISPPVPASIRQIRNFTPERSPYGPEPDEPEATGDQDCERVSQGATSLPERRRHRCQKVGGGIEGGRRRISQSDRAV